MFSLMVQTMTPAEDTREERGSVGPSHHFLQGFWGPADPVMAKMTFEIRSLDLAIWHEDGGGWREV